MHKLCLFCLFYGSKSRGFSTNIFSFVFWDKTGEAKDKNANIPEKISQSINISIYKYLNIKISQYINISIYIYIS